MRKRIRKKRKMINLLLETRMRMQKSNLMMKMTRILIRKKMKILIKKKIKALRKKMMIKNLKTVMIRKMKPMMGQTQVQQNQRKKTTDQLMEENQQVQ